MRLKDNTIDVNGLKPEMMILVGIILTVERLYNIEFRITAISDYKHSKNSNHYKGYAIDLGVKEFPRETITALYNAIKERINCEYNILHEGVGFNNEHFHVEYNPVYQPN